MAAKSSNPLVSSQKSSQLQAILHPLVLLTVSDYITRHTLRKQEGPVIGALLGQQNGREITIEHAFECHTREAPGVKGDYMLDDVKFGARLEQSMSCLLLAPQPKKTTNCLEADTQPLSFPSSSCSGHSP